MMNANGNKIFQMNVGSAGNGGVGMVDPGGFKNIAVESPFGANNDDKQFTKIQRYQFIDRMLNDNFPMAFTLILALLDFFTGAVLIGLQILCIIYRTPLFFVAVGIWYGVFIIFSELIVIALIFHRSCLVFMISIVFHVINVAIGLIAAICQGVEVLVSFYIYSNTTFIWLNYSIAGLSVFSVFPALFYLFIFKRQFQKYHQIFSIDTFYNRN